MVNARSRCAARLNVGGVVVTACAVVLSYVGAPPPGRGIDFGISAVRLAAASAPLSAQWAALDQFITAAAQLGAGATAVPTTGPSTGSQPAEPVPLAATSTAPAGPTPLAATPTPLAGIPVISDIGSAIASAFWSLVGPLVNNAVVGPFVLFGGILFGIFVVAPIMVVVETVQQFFAPLLSLLPLAASPAAAKTVAPTAAVPDPTAAAKTVAPVAGADVVKAPDKPTRGFTPKRQKPAAVTSTAATADVDATGNGTTKGRQANQLNAPGVRGNGGAMSGTGSSDTGKLLSRNKKSSHDDKSGGGGPSIKTEKGDS